MPNPTHHDEARLAIARGAAARAAAVCRHVRNRLYAVRSMTKDDRSPVTIADFASQALIARALREHDPATPLVAEESGEFLRARENAAHLAGVVEALRASHAWPDADERGLLDAIDRGAGEPAASGFWTLDPIDGTKGFLRGGQYCVSLAYIEDFRVRVGVLVCPALSAEPGISPESAVASGSSYSAIMGRGAHMHLPEDDGPTATPLLRTELDPSHAARLAESVEPGHTRQDIADELMRLVGPVGSPIRVDSQCKYALIARGDADVYLRLPTRPGYIERIWDHAAGALIAQEAGCVVTDLRGQRLDFGLGRGLDANLGVIAAPPGLHGRLLQASARMGLALGT